MGRETQQKLRSTGPLTADELGSRPTITDKQNQTTAFSISGHGATKTVYYLHEEHEEKEVLEKWLEVNSHINVTNNRSLYLSISNAGNGWKQAAREVLEVEWNQGSSSGADGGECPACGETYSHSLAEHVPDCSEL